MLTLDLPHGLHVAALTWGPDDGPLAVLLHGFPDTAHTWRHLGPRLAADGWRVVAPFSRGYAPTGLAPDGSYHVPALAHDAIALHAALGGDRRAVLVGHDWGALTAHGVGAHAGSPYRALVTMSVPPVPALVPRPRDLPGVVPLLARQLRLSWYTLFNQLPVLPERHFDRLVTRLWADWSPGLDATEDLAHLARALPDREHRAAAVGYYRAAPRRWRLPATYAALADDWLRAPRVPTLYLHGDHDGCLDPRLAGRAGVHLPPGSRAEVVPGAGHFLQLDRPEEVGERIAAFLAALPEVS